MIPSVSVCNEYIDALGVAQFFRQLLRGISKIVLQFNTFAIEIFQ